MIVVQLLGGLGNQLFQYAAGRALAVRHGVSLRLDARGLGAPSSPPHARRYGLAPFAIAAAVGSAAALKVFGVQRRLRLARRLQERGFAYDPAFESAGPRTYLAGYWQSERYFAAIAPAIRRELTVRTAPAARDAALLEEIARVDAISVHVRRGDYVTNAASAAVHGVLPLDYYQRAAARLVAETPDPRFYVFSDEPAWARAHLALPGPTTVVDHRRDDDPHEDLRLMRACRHHIIANSTFSWWGAWLSERPGQRVVAPRQWFRTADLDASDVCPPRWIRV